MARIGFFFSAERCAWRNGCGETAAKIGRGNVSAGEDWVVVAMARVLHDSLHLSVGGIFEARVVSTCVDAGKFWSSEL